MSTAETAWVVLGIVLAWLACWRATFVLGLALCSTRHDTDEHGCRAFWLYFGWLPTMLVALLVLSLAPRSACSR